VIDIIPPVQHPVAGTSCINFDFLDWLRMIFGIIILLLLLIFFWNPIIFILKLVIKILIAPFKLIGSLFSKNKNNENASGDKKADKKIKKLDKKIKKLEKQSRKLRKKR